MVSVFITINLQFCHVGRTDKEFIAEKNPESYTSRVVIEGVFSH